MPYDYDPNLDPNATNQQPGQNAPQLAGGSQVVGGSAATAAGGSAGANAPSSGQGANTAGGGQVQSDGSPAPTSSGSYQNLNSYLTANQGNGFGQQFVGDVNNTVNQAQSAQQQGLQNFQGASDAGSTKLNQGLIDQAINDPNGFSKNADNMTAFQGQLNAKYSGPQAFSDDQAAYQQAQGATQRSQDTAQAANTEPGRFALLNNYFGNSNYTQGQQGLDNLLLQGDSATQQGLQQSQQNANAAQTSFQGLMPQAANYAAQNAASTNALGGKVMGQGTTAIGNLNTQYGQQLSAAQAAQGAAADKLAALNGSDSSKWAAILGQYGAQSSSNTDPLLTNPSLNVNSSSNYWGVKPTTGLPSLEAPPTMSNVTTSDQQSKLNALQGLFNHTQTTFDPTVAGSYNPANPLSFNTGAFNAAQTAAQQAYAQKESPIMKNIQDLASTGGNIAKGGNVQLTRVAQDQGLQIYLDKLNPIRAQYGLAPINLSSVEAEPNFKSGWLTSGGIGPIVTPAPPGSSFGGSTPLL